MADTKVSLFTDGATIDAGDRIPVARAPYAPGDNRYVTRGYFKTYFDTLYEVAGAVAAHEAAANPHPVYLTQAEGDAFYAALTHAHGKPDLPAAVAYEDEANNFGTNIQTITRLRLAEQAEPASPPADSVEVYATDDNTNTVLEFKAPDGSVMRLGPNFIAKNTQGSAITLGQAVYLDSGVGASGTPTVKLAKSDAVATLPCIGVVFEASIANNGFGRIIRTGIVRGLNTSGFLEGDRLFVSDATAGALTATAPSHPSMRQRAAIVVNAHAVNGTLFVDPVGVRGDHEGTNQNQWLVGSNTAGSKDVVFRNGFDLTLRANPTGGRTVTLPDATGTLATQAYADAAVATHEGAADPHTGYQRESEKDAANGYAGVDADVAVLRAKALRETGGPTNLVVGTITDGQYLRRIGATIVSGVPAGGGGGFAASEVEVDVGSVPVFQGKFTITDAGITVGAKVLVWQAPGPYTGKGTRADEAEMDRIIAYAEPAGAGGSAVVKWKTEQEVRMIPQMMGSGRTFLTPAHQDDPQAIKTPRRIGRVRGNVKFHYAVAA